ncbi:MAG TPA: tyrosine-type recombinase/integrase [Gemmatimonadales bacterium]|nr:tyrosine-type recombinase/integrase [Gemmatimonadales bacterium]
MPTWPGRSTGEPALPPWKDLDREGTHPARRVAEPVYGLGERGRGARYCPPAPRTRPKGGRDWLVIDAVHSGALGLGRLWDAAEAGELDRLRQELQDTDVEPHLARWLREVATRTAADTVAHYRKHVRTLIPEGEPFPASRLTVRTIRDWIAGLPVGPITQRKYHAALSSFADYLVDGEVLPANPVRSVRRPPPTRPRTRYLEHPEVLRLVEAMPGPFRALSAIVHATGIELSVAVGLLRRDIDLDRLTLHARGTKSSWRDRVVGVEPWALPYFADQVRLLTPEASVFPGMSRWTASDVHRRVCAELGIKDYQFRDARHTYAVRMMRAGTPPEMIGRQLGHANPVMVNKVYGRFHPDHNDLSKWHEAAARIDQTRGIG